MGFYRMAEESLPFLDEEEKRVLKAYVDGINDYVAGISFVGGKTGAIFPPEFYLFGMTEEILRPFSIPDVLAYGRLISF